MIKIFEKYKEKRLYIVVKGFYFSRVARSISRFPFLGPESRSTVSPKEDNKRRISPLAQYVVSTAPILRQSYSRAKAFGVHISGCLSGAKASKYTTSML